MTRHRSVPLTTRSAKLSTDFGLEWATKLFGAEAIDSLPKLTRGPGAGRPKGFVVWRKALESGWCSETYSPVAKDSLIDAWIGVGACSVRSDAVCGKWLGRIQSLAGSRFFLFEQGRQRHADEQARLAQEWALERAELLAEKLGAA